MPERAENLYLLWPDNLRENYFILISALMSRNRDHVAAMDKAQRSKARVPMACYPHISSFAR